MSADNRLISEDYPSPNTPTSGWRNEFLMNGLEEQTVKIQDDLRR